MSRDAGFSILELIIGLGLLSAVVLYGLSVVQFAHKEGNLAFRRTSSRTETLQVLGPLQKSIATGDLRFFGFAGKNQGKELARWLLPLPGVCGDFTTQNPKCRETTTVVYPTYDRSTTPTVSALCRITNLTAAFSDGGATTSSRWEYLLIEMSHNPYGTATRNAQGQLTIAPNRDSPGGEIRLSQVGVDYPVIAVVRAPQATLWVARSLTLASLADLQVVATSDAACGSRLQAGATYGIVQMEPFRFKVQIDGVAKDITKGAVSECHSGAPTWPSCVYRETLESQRDSVQETRRIAALQLPARLMNVRIKSVGWTPSSAELGEVRVSDHPVRWSGGGATGTVSPKQLIHPPEFTSPAVVRDVEPIRVHLKFKRKLKCCVAASASCAQTDPSASYEIVLPSVNQPACGGGALTMNPLHDSGVPVLAAHESIENLQAPQFSFTKLEDLVALQLEFRSNQRKEMLNVFFP